MDTNRLSAMLHESASEITAQPPVLPAGPPPRRRWILAIPALVLLLVAGAVVGVVKSNNKADDEAGLAATDRWPSPQFERVGHNGVSVEVPASWDVVEANDCSKGGLSTDAVIQLDGSVEACLGYRAAASNRVYITDLSRPPYGEPWDEITEDARSSNGVPIRRVTTGSLVGMNSVATFAITVPQRDVAIIATGPNLDVTRKVIDSVRVE